MIIPRSLFLFAAAVFGSLFGFFGPFEADILALIALGMLIICFFKKHLSLQMGSILLLIWAASGFYAAHTLYQYLETQKKIPSDAVIFEGIVKNISQRLDGSIQALFEASGIITLEKSRYPISATFRVSLNESAMAFPVREMDEIRLFGKAEIFTPSENSRQFDAFHYGVSQHVHGRIYVNDLYKVGLIKRHAAINFFVLKSWFRNRLMSLLTPLEAGLLLALAVGDTSLFEEDQRQAYQEIGAGHLLAVSGLQVSLLAWLFYRLFLVLFNLLPFTARRSKAQLPAAFFTLFWMWSFIAVCGFPSSAVRAGFMATVMLTPVLFRQIIRPLDSLAAAGFLTVICAPACVLDPGFVLSYAAVFGLLYADTLWKAFTKSDEMRPDPSVLLIWLGQLFLLSYCTFLATAPFAITFFGTISVGGIVANILLVPLSACTQIAAIALAFFSALFNSPLLATAAKTLASLIEISVFGLRDYLGALWYLPKQPLWSYVFLATAFALIPLLFCSSKRFLNAFFILLLLAIGCSPHLSTRNGLRIDFLPVGHGDSALIELSDGQIFLIDGGGGYKEIAAQSDPGKRIVWPFLKERGVKTIDVMVVSHPDPDHIMGLFYILEHMKVKEIWHSGFSTSHPLQKKLIMAAESKNIPVKNASELLGSHIYGDSVVEVLAPSFSPLKTHRKDLSTNNNSLVVRFSYKGHRALFLGDLEREGEQRLLLSHDDVSADVIKAPHHGSKTSSTAELVHKTHPKYVVFSTRKNNQWHFPHKEVVDRWVAEGAMPYNTATNGLITFWFKASGIETKATQRALAKKRVGLFFTGPSSKSSEE